MLLLNGVSNSLCLQVAVDMDFNVEMVKLHQRVHPMEIIVGW